MFHLLVPLASLILAAPVPTDDPVRTFTFRYATTVGPVVGAMLFWFLREGVESFIRELSEQGWLPDILADFLDGAEGAISIALMGIGLVALMALRPQGIFGRRRNLHLGT